MRDITLCRYFYDPLDQLIQASPLAGSESRRFYRKGRLTTEIQGQLQYSVFQYDDQLLAQRRHDEKTAETTLLATNQQRSVLDTVNTNLPSTSAYSPYGYRAANSGLISLMGFNGQRWEPVTGRYMLGNGYRAFNSVLMRFHTPDSWSPFGDGGLNPYAYCLGDPVNLSDPLGHASIAQLFQVQVPKYLQKGSSRSIQKTIAKATKGKPNTIKHSLQRSELATKKHESIKTMLSESIALERSQTATGEIKPFTLTSEQAASKRFFDLKHSDVPLDAEGIPNPKQPVTAKNPSGQTYLRTDFFDEAISFFHHQANGNRKGNVEFSEAMERSAGIALYRRAKYIRKHALRDY